MPTDFDALWLRVVAECSPKHLSAHGPDRWRRVERNARVLATRTGASVEVVRLFAVFHDAKREKEGYDKEHGIRGAAYAETLRGSLFHLEDEDFERLLYACVWHTDGVHHDDPTIGTCWDADRLDLGRVGLIPDAAFLSTDFGKEIATYGSLQPWAHLAPPIW